MVRVVTAAASTDPDRERGQTETVGVTLLVGVFAVVALIVGTAIVAQTNAATDRAASVDLVTNVSSENVTLTHNGGGTYDLADLRVVLSGESDQRRFTPDPGNVTGSDDRFDPGDEYHREHGLSAGRVDLLLVHEPSGTVLYRETLEIPA